MKKQLKFMPLYANKKGEVIEQPRWQMLGRSGMDWIEPQAEEMIPLPRGAALVSVPGQAAVALERDQLRLLNTSPNGEPVQAVAALLPQGFTRTLLPACVSPSPGEVLPLQGYAAVGFSNGKLWVAAVQTDEHRKWHPCHYNTAGLPGRIDRILKRHPGNRILRQLAKCSLQYGCYTAQNIFYGRWEGGIPTTKACNADCIGCISESHVEVDSPQQRLDFQPSVQEICEIGIMHLSQAQEGIISFGQGCEGEPSLNADTIAPAVNAIREQTGQGTININTNAGYRMGIEKICRAGLDAMRVTIFSCREDNYEAYHRPCNYSLQDVAASICCAKAAGVRVALNLLCMPGFTDREEEIEALLRFVRQNEVDMIQMRNLNIDPELLFQAMGQGGEVLGVVNFLHLLRQELPGVKIGSYTHPVKNK